MKARTTFWCLWIHVISILLLSKIAREGLTAHSVSKTEWKHFYNLGASSIESSWTFASVLLYSWFETKMHLADAVVDLYNVLPTTANKAKSKLSFWTFFLILTSYLALAPNHRIQQQTRQFQVTLTFWPKSSQTNMIGRYTEPQIAAHNCHSKSNLVWSLLYFKFAKELVNIFNSA